VWKGTQTAPTAWRGSLLTYKDDGNFRSHCDGLMVWSGVWRWRESWVKTCEDEEQVRCVVLRLDAGGGRRRRSRSFILLALAVASASAWLATGHGREGAGALPGQGPIDQSGAAGQLALFGLVAAAP
jgi:hypothetical protein